MALYDNKAWLLSHIRNSFISTDDTGMCELIMAGQEPLRRQLKQTLDLFPDEEESDDEDDLSHESYDLQPDVDFGMRCRSNTAARLEKLESSKRKAGKIKHVKWEMSKTPISQEQLNEIFVRKEPKERPKQPIKSLLSQTFSQYTSLPRNPYIEYAKFDGAGQVNVSTKKYRIFLTMLPESQRNYPIHVCCLASARITDLIGLILLKCSTQFEGHAWKPVSSYGLYITEDDGEVDRDFPCLDAKENIAKFGFACLGLVEHTEAAKAVTFEENDTIAISGPFQDGLRAGLGGAEGRRAKEQAKSELEKISTDLHLMDVHNKSMEAPLYKSYRVHIITKMRAKTEILLGVSGEKIEIDPVQQGAKFALVRQKPINHDIDSIAWCDVVDIKSNKTVFRLVYSNSFGSSDSAVSSLSPQMNGAPNFKNYDFEADHTTAEEIVEKVSLILRLRSSETRKEYLAMQERKQYKKRVLL